MAMFTTKHYVRDTIYAWNDYPNEASDEVAHGSHPSSSSKQKDYLSVVIDTNQLVIHRLREENTRGNVHSALINVDETGITIDESLDDTFGWIDSLDLYTLYPMRKHEFSISTYLDAFECMDIISQFRRNLHLNDTTAINTDINARSSVNIDGFIRSTVLEKPTHGYEIIMCILDQVVSILSPELVLRTRDKYFKIIRLTLLSMLRFQDISKPSKVCALKLLLASGDVVIVGKLLKQTHDMESLQRLIDRVKSSYDYMVIGNSDETISEVCTEKSIRKDFMIHENKCCLQPNDEIQISTDIADVRKYQWRSLSNILSNSYDEIVVSV